MGNLKNIIKIAFRDIRKNLGRLFMFMSSIVLGVAALVAINSFNYNLAKDIDNQTASLIGADLAISSTAPISYKLKSVLDSLEAEEAEEWDMLSMAYFPSIDESQFVRIKALKGDFPFYGTMSTEPPDAKDSYKTGKFALVDEGLMDQKKLIVGDSIKLGRDHFEIIGKLISTTGGAAITAGFAPTVYIGLSQLQSTNLVQPGSLINYSLYFKTNQATDIDQWEEKYEDKFAKESVRTETVSERKATLNEAFGALNDFLGLVALVSLLLGCIGVASSVFIYTKSKVSSIAILRCLGMSGWQATGVFFFQILGLSLIGAVLGATIGSWIQVLIPDLLKDFLPFEVSLTISWKAIVSGIIFGLFMTVFFAAVPLVGIRKISPLRALRKNFRESDVGTDWVKIGIYIAIFAIIFSFLFFLTGSISQATTMSIGLTIAFGFLYLVSYGFIFLLKRYFPRDWNFAWRQGLSNLFRPNNQTQILLVSLGLGTAVLTTLLIIQGILLGNIQNMDAGNQPNMILYGIEKNQTEELISITDSFNLPINEQVPIVTMRLVEWQGKTKAEWLSDTTRTAKRWVIHRETRATYRDTLDGYEELVAGEFPKYSTNEDSIFISLSDAYAEDLDVGIGDELVFNVQGSRIVTYVGSLRKIAFNNLRPRFFIVFHANVLENAPQFLVMVTKSPDPLTTAEYRNAVVQKLPNISVVDLASILKAVTSVFNKVSYVVRFLASFCILTGLVVLLSSLLLSKYQRIREGVLLRTLGASRRQVLRINGIEYFLIGFLSSLTGIVIALIGSYAWTIYQDELIYSVNGIHLLWVLFGVTMLTVIVGIFNSREVVNKPPLAVLRGN